MISEDLEFKSIDEMIEEYNPEEVYDICIRLDVSNNVKLYRILKNLFNESLEDCVLYLLKVEPFERKYTVKQPRTIGNIHSLFILYKRYDYELKEITKENMLEVLSTYPNLISVLYDDSVKGIMCMNDKPKYNNDILLNTFLKVSSIPTLLSKIDKFGYDCDNTPFRQHDDIIIKHILSTEGAVKFKPMREEDVLGLIKICIRHPEYVERCKEIHMNAVSELYSSGLAKYNGIGEDGFSGLVQ